MSEYLKKFSLYLIKEMGDSKDFFGREVENSHHGDPPPPSPLFLPPCRKQHNVRHCTF